MTEVEATSKSLRVSPKKVRIVAKNFQGQKALVAVDSLRFVSKKAAVPLAKVIKSAIANAKQNNKLAPEKLVIKEITVDEGPSLKRWRPAARGAAHSILKRTSHIKVVLEGT
ncbi:MAG: 50S ribosomal protein L22 [Candidatus Woykebacteria bacterium GWB1_45_5]|uniref:Large ribosomal subunit protein uL22 n=2 Tax=Candidatus Woykeibacteriota TaxID=1817899 RepID=A0A1G1W2L7_9BACT|nr:MAG: 50S ribosomal protein L22 [Candidatus Woykebacteria bacterium GWA1_44_8]OGY23328.1 MAG: 50S ribosomal protein L22 [Candidatus Woykebacteria bacterium GWB1_45_5]